MKNSLGCLLIVLMLCVAPVILRLCKLLLSFSASALFSLVVLLGVFTMVRLLMYLVRMRDKGNNYHGTR